MGFERIYVLQHHQGVDGGQALALRRAAYECWREDGRRLGPGWGRVPNERPPPEAERLMDRIVVAHVDSFLPDGSVRFRSVTGARARPS